MKRKLIAVGVAALAVAGGGVAVAATGIGTPQEESKAVVDDAAKQLGVSPGELSAALKQALAHRVDAAVAAGNLTKAQGEDLKARIQSDDFPVLGALGRGHHGDHGGPHGGVRHLAAAATYLGLTGAQLRTQVEGGKTLAEVAKAQGKTVDGLVAALVADEKTEVDAAVTAGRLTRAQADELLSGAKERFTDLVNGERPEHGGHGLRGFGGPPPGAPSSFSAAFATASI